MKEKILLFTLSIIAISSCSTQRQSENTGLVIYEMEGIRPEYLILRENTTQQKVYEYFIPVIQGGYIGKWENKEDTLFLYPEYEYSSSLDFETIKVEEQGLFRLDRKYLITKERLYDITYFPDKEIDLDRRGSLKRWKK